MNLNNIDKVIELKEKTLELTKELKESLLYEQCTHEVVKIPLSKTSFIYVVYEIKTKKEVFENKSLPKINQWLERRGFNKVYKKF